MKQKCKNCGMTCENDWCENPTKDYSCDFKNVPHVWENMMKQVVIESPFAGDVEIHIKYARRAMADSLKRSEAPYASHLLFTQEGILDDTIPEERKLGMEVGLLWCKGADLTAVYTDYGISKGMEYGIERAKQEGRPIEYREIGKNDDLHKMQPNEVLDELIAEVFGVEEGVVPNKTAGEAILQIRDLWKIANLAHRTLRNIENGYTYSLERNILYTALGKLNNKKETTK